MVIWGDRTTSVESITEGDVVDAHTYVVPGTYTIIYATRDSSGKKSFAANQTWTVPDLATSVCHVEGNIKGSETLSGTLLTLNEGMTVVKRGLTDVTGHYTLPNVQAGRTYTIIPSRNEYTFSPESDMFTLDCVSSSSGHDFTAISLY